VDLLSPVAAAFILGLLVAPAAPHEGIWPALAALFALTTGLVVMGAGRRWHGPRSERWARPALMAAAFMAGAAAVASPAPAPEVPRGLCRITGVVEAGANAGPRSHALLRVERGRRMHDGQEVPAGALVRVVGRSLPVGARVTALLHLEPHAPFRNVSPHPSLDALEPLAARGRVPATAPVHVVEPPSLPRRVLEAARQAVRTRITATLPQDVAGVARALVLGEAGAVAPSERQAVRDAGLSHVLAVSGLHVAIVAGMLVWLVGQACSRVPWLALRAEARRLAAAAGVPISLAFAAFAGGAPSAWRAAATASLGWALVACGRRPQAGRVLAMAVLLLAAGAPTQVHRPGFLLSVAATVALVTSPPVQGAWHSLLVLSTRAMLGTAPLVLWWFGSVPLVGLLGNVLLVPVGSILLVPLAVAHALAALLGWPGALTGPVLTWVARGFVVACDALAQVPYGRDLPPPSLAQGLVLAIGCAALLLARRWRARAGWVLATLLALAGGEAWLRHTEHPRDRLRITFVDVGQGDAALVDLPDGTAMLIDAGGAVHGPDPGARALLPLLQARRRSRIDVAVVSHPHPDHFGGLFALLDRVRIEQVWTTRQGEEETPDGPATDVLRALTARGSRLVYPAELCARPRRMGGVRIEVLWPCPGYDAGLDPNDNSIVVRLTYGQVRVLFTGDVELLAEQALTARPGSALAAHVLKVPHHGSRTSSSEAFLDAVRPRWAVVSAAAQSPFGHPHPEVVERYRDRRIPLARTDQMGSVVVETDGRALELRSWRGDRWRATVDGSAPTLNRQDETRPAPPP
jgi:competence protein ComEC